VLEKYQAVSQKRFPHTPVNEMQNLSDLSLNELIERIETDNTLHGTHLAARETGPPPSPAHNDRTRKNFFTLVTKNFIPSPHLVKHCPYAGKP